MSKAAKLSVVIPCYNIEKYFLSCINCIFQNNVSGVEIIFIDDGSTDNFSGAGISAYFGQSLENNYAEFEYNGAKVIIERQNHSGVSVARNRGITLATGKYIVFIDPDDLFSPDWFTIAFNEIDCIKADMVIFGFQSLYLNNDNEITKKQVVMPIKNYDFLSNNECIYKMLPLYLGYSIENIKKWPICGYISGQLEFGSVWRNVYRREFLIQNDITFSPHIRLNEDSMFNARCCMYARRIKSVSSSHYYYLRRDTGALAKGINAQNDFEGFINNKLNLVRERNDIVCSLAEIGYDFSIWNFAGSCVLSVMEIIVKCPLGKWKSVKVYLKNNVVKNAIKITPYIGIKKFDFPLWAIKHKMSFLLWLFIKTLQKIGLKISL